MISLLWKCFYDANAYNLVLKTWKFKTVIYFFFISLIIDSTFSITLSKNALTSSGSYPLRTRLNFSMLSPQKFSYHSIFISALSCISLPSVSSVIFPLTFTLFGVHKNIPPPTFCKSPPIA